MTTELDRNVGPGMSTAAAITKVFALVEEGCNDGGRLQAISPVLENPQNCGKACVSSNCEVSASGLQAVAGMPIQVGRKDGIACSGNGVATRSYLQGLVGKNIDDVSQVGEQRRLVISEMEGKNPLQPACVKDVDGPFKMGRSFVEAAKHNQRKRELKKLEVCIDPIGVVLLPNDLAEKGTSRWKNILIGVVLGRKIPLGVTDKNVRRMWNRWGVLEVGTAGE